MGGAAGAGCQVLGVDVRQCGDPARKSPAVLFVWGFSESRRASLPFVAWDTRPQPRGPGRTSLPQVIVNPAKAVFRKICLEL